jgi:hypothetical protein
VRALCLLSLRFLLLCVPIHTSERDARNLFEDALGGCVELVGWNAQHFEAVRLHEAIAGRIVFDALGVGWAVEFDHELGFVAVEIGEVWTNGVLAAELEIGELSIAQHAPERGFAFSLVAAEMGAEVERPVLLDEVAGEGVEVSRERFFRIWWRDE